MHPKKHLGFDESHQVIKFPIFTRRKHKFSLFQHTEVFIELIYFSSSLQILSHLSYNWDNIIVLHL